MVQLIAILLTILLFSLDTCAAPLWKEVITQQEKDGKLRVYIPFSVLSDLKGNLRGNEAILSIDFPLPSRWLVLSAVLHLEYSSSILLLPERSEMLISLNGHKVYQTKKIGSLTDTGNIDINVSGFLFKDFNKLQIAVIQHYCLDCCEAPSAPELWTDIDMENSFLVLTVKELPFPEKLEAISEFLFDYKNIAGVKFSIITEEESDEFLSMAGIVASYAGMKVKYRPIKVLFRKEISPNEDIVIIGTEKFIQKKLGIKLPFTVNGATVGILRNPLNPAKGIVVLTGKNREDLKLAVLSFASYTQNVPTSQFVKIKSVKLPEVKPYESPGMIPLGKEITLKDLGKSTTIFKYFYPPPLTLYFRIPSDILTETKDKAKLTLFVSYGAALREDSVINIFVNDKFIASRRLGEFEGENDKKIEIEFPVYNLQKGSNTLEIYFAMVPDEKGKCETFNVQNMVATLFDKSSIFIPKLPHWTKMAYINYFFDTAYPFSIYPDFSQALIYLTDKTPDTISAYLTLMAFVGERTMFPTYRVSVTTNISTLKNSSKDLLIIGKLEELPIELKENSPLSLRNGILTIHYPLMKRIGNYLKEILTGREERENEYESIVKLEGGLSNLFVAMAFESPYENGKTVVLFSSTSPKTLLRGMEFLFHPETIGKLYGDTVLFDVDSKKSWGIDIGDKYFVGTLPFYERFFFLVGYSWKYMLMVSIVVIALLALSLKYILDRREKKLLGEETNDTNRENG
jgi:hypothetical protein